MFFCCVEHVWRPLLMFSECVLSSNRFDDLYVFHQRNKAFAEWIGPSVVLQIAGGWDVFVWNQALQNVREGVEMLQHTDHISGLNPGPCRLGCGFIAPRPWRVPSPPPVSLLGFWHHDCPADNLLFPFNPAFTEACAFPHCALCSLL